MKNKGIELEEHTAKRFSDNGYPCKRDSRSGAGNNNKSDIDGLAITTGQGYSVHVECKDHTTLKTVQWYKDMKSKLTLAEIGMLVFKKRSQPLHDSMVLISLDDLLDLLDQPDHRKDMSRDPFSVTGSEARLVLNSLNNSYIKANVVMNENKMSRNTDKETDNIIRSLKMKLNDFLKK